MFKIKEMKKITLLVICFLSISQFVDAQFVEERKIEKDEVVIKDQEMEILVFNDLTKKPIQADISIVGLNPRKTVKMKAVEDTVFAISNYRIYSVTCVEKGYMIYSEKFWPEEKQLHVQKVGLKNLEIGLKTNLRDIFFVGNATQIYGKSKPAIDDLVRWLKLNKKVKIAVIGHVNGPNNDKSERYYQKASLERANTIIKYLVDKGIKEERLVAKGEGNIDMIYPNPETTWQAEANRRIEIEVIAID